MALAGWRPNEAPSKVSKEVVVVVVTIEVVAALVLLLVAAVNVLVAWGWQGCVIVVGEGVVLAADQNTALSLIKKGQRQRMLLESTK